MTGQPSRTLLFSAMTILIFIFMVVILLVVGEYSIRLSKKYANYYEHNGENWDPDRTKEVLAEPWLWINPKNETRVVEKKEYRQVFHFGPEGLPDQTPLKKEKEECRIIVVGDSFVQGYGDTENIGVVGRLKKILDENMDTAKPYSIMNAGIGGSDPVYELEFISRVLLKYEPNLVLLVINYSDIQDLKRRGGLERFTPDGQLKTKQPWWTWIYNQSHLFRAFVIEVLRYDADLIPVSESLTREKNAIEGIIQAISAINQLAKQNSFQLIVLIHPLQMELQNSRLSVPLLSAKDSLQKRGIGIIDLTNQFRKRIPRQSESNYYWEVDGHYTPKGYDVFALAIEAELRQTFRDCTENFFVRDKN